MNASRTFLCLSILLAGLVACSRPERPGVQPENLLLITVEGLRADHLSSLGYHRDTTNFHREDDAPAFDLDWLAESGVSFSDAQAASSSARTALATLHTGAAPITHGAIGPDRVLPAQLPTLAEDLQAAGFRTVAFACSPHALAGSGLERGFELFEELNDDHHVLQGFAADLDAASSDPRPRFWWLHLSGPRQPWSPAAIDTAPDFHAPFLDGLDRGRVREDTGYFDALRAREFAPDGGERAALVALYDSEILRVDFLVRRGLESLATAQGHSEFMKDTLIVFAGASGVELGERPGAWRDDSSLHGNALHVPLVLKHPGSFTGRRILGGVVEHADLAPTLRELFAVRGLRDGERSLLARTDSYRPRNFPARPALALGGDAEGGLSLGMLVGDDRLLLDYRDTPRLFDVARDPCELHDLSAERPDRLRSLCGIAFDTLLASETHPELMSDGREYLLRTLHQYAGRKQVD